ncbi:hypothetical protein [Flavobacterium oreochromis]|uniref:Outer membrane protein beta-barrel domain-containing protein n=2 Tax=Flavobacterium TaxID=237 RepID=A0A246GB92_9FLAO|nr:hypothetical protein [Flavobacterium oreochromis]OWP77033.1 hypothetical protein BWG23_06420 [Flavobacterium oreochromis]OWP77816.1 hypothetical protein BWK62_06570 [Flavobacterium oreochromis]POR28868.1 hypothetical protein BWK58_02855 [Flavobacterium columnare]QYS85381.1 hypothetical protein JJC03_09010 [Flavobacterium oreochromis]
MKKILLTAAAVFAFGFANAQESYKPIKGTLTTEVGVTGGILDTNFGTINGAAKFRYFIKDDLAVRAGLGLGSNKREQNNITNQGLPTEFTTTEVARTTNRVITLGAEKHFAGTDRLSTYVGADIVFGFTGAEYKVTRSNSNDSMTQVGAVNNLGIIGNGSSTFGIRATVGADYYFTKKLYLGVEVGLGYNAGTQDAVETTTVIGNTTTVNKTGEGKTSNTYTNAIGGLKLGFQF